MPKPQSEALKGALAAFAPKLKFLLDRDGMSESALGRALKRRGQVVATKTINNLVQARHNAQLGNLAVIADHFGVPLWVMLIPNLPPEMLQDSHLKRLAALVQDYIQSSPSGRTQAEHVASAMAAVQRASSLATSKLR